MPELFHDLFPVCEVNTVMEAAITFVVKQAPPCVNPTLSTQEEIRLGVKKVVDHARTLDLPRVHI